jgi:O-antigen/teichoic acid export membrane protein
MIACMRYELVILLPEKDEDAINIFALSIIIALAFAGISIPVVLIGRHFIAQLFNAPELSNYLFLLPFIILLMGFSTTFYYWMLRKKFFKSIAVSNISGAVVFNGTEIGAGIGGYPTGGSLIGANILSTFTSTAILGHLAWKNELKFLWKKINLQDMKKGLIRYRKFPLIDSWSAILNNLSARLPELLLSAFFSPVVVGYYYLGFRVLKYPMSFIGDSISQAFFSEAAEAKRDGTLSMLTEKMFQVLLKLSMFPLLVLTFTGRDLFIFVFGKTWAEAGLYAQFLSIWIIFWFIASPISTIIAVEEKLHVGFLLTVISLIFRILSLYIGGTLGNPLIAVALFSLTGLFFNGLSCLVFLHIVGVPLVMTVKRILQGLCYFLPAGAVIVLMKYLAASSLIITFISLILILIYYFIIIKTDPLIHNIYLQLLQNVKNVFKR